MQTGIVVLFVSVIVYSTRPVFGAKMYEEENVLKGQKEDLRRDNKEYVDNNNVVKNVVKFEREDVSFYRNSPGMSRLIIKRIGCKVDGPCYNMPLENAKYNIPHWLQTMNYTHRSQERYKIEIFSKIHCESSISLGHLYVCDSSICDCAGSDLSPCNKFEKSEKGFVIGSFRLLKVFPSDDNPSLLETILKYTGFI